jgi:MOSC domain-containing protein YiiM
MGGVVTTVSRSATHTFTKSNQESIRLIVGLGIEGDAHMGETVKHRSRVAVDPTQPNLRQVHLIHAELHDELRAAGFVVSAGQMGENVTTRGIDLLGLPTSTRLHLGNTAIVELTGLRNPCAQLDRFQSGLMAAVLGRGDRGKLIRKAGVMGIVVVGGEVQPGNPIRIELPPEPHQPLDRV